MASTATKLTFRLIIIAASLLIMFYVGRPLYWKLSATVRHNKQTVSGGISKIVKEAQRSVGWYHDEFDSGLREDKKLSATRRLLLGQVL